MTNPDNKEEVQKVTCANCGHEYAPAMTPGLGDGCPKCVVDFLRGDTVAVEADDNARKPLQSGDSIGGVDVVELLGRGGMGTVYKARQTKLNRIVALKVLDSRLAASPEFTSRFSREARALASLNHPNIVQIHDYGQEDDRYYLVMEYVEGTNLRQILSTQRVSPAAALRYVPQICDALDYAHGEGVIHRDVKPENILIDNAGNLKIADFGLAKIGTTEEHPASLVTEVDRVMGTPNYMAPEQMRQTASVDHRADIYSLGVVFYEMLTGELPMGNFTAPSQRVQVDVSVDEVVMKALEQDPDRRYQHASQVKADVSTATTTKPTAAAPAPQAVDASDARLCSLALVGAFCLPWGMAVLWEIARSFNEVYAQSPTAFHASETYRYFLRPVGIVTAIAATLLGWTSMRQVERSAGKLCGRMLAIVNLCAYPLLVVTLFIAHILPNTVADVYDGTAIPGVLALIPIVILPVMVGIALRLAIRGTRINIPSPIILAMICAMLAAGWASLFLAGEKRAGAAQFVFARDALSKFNGKRPALPPISGKQNSNSIDDHNDNVHLSNALNLMRANWFGQSYLKRLDDRHDNFLWWRDGGAEYMFWIEPGLHRISCDRSLNDGGYGNTIGGSDWVYVEAIARDGNKLAVTYSVPSGYMITEDPERKSFHDEIKRRWGIESDHIYEVRIPVDDIFSYDVDFTSIWKNGNMIGPCYEEIQFQSN